MEGSSLSPRMSSEHENTDRFPPKCIFKHFKRQKVAISNAIKTTFPFLEGLRDHELITGKMYDDLQESLRALVPVDKVIYRALEELEKNFKREVLNVLFNEVNMEKYPDLKLIHKSFKNEFPNELCFQGSDGEDPNSQLSLEQGPSGSCSQGSLTWSPLDPSSSEVWRSNDRRNFSFIQVNQTENHQLSKSPNHLDSGELPVQMDGREAATPKLHWGKNRAVHVNHELQINPCFVDLVDIKKENSSFFLDVNQQTQARTNQNEESEIIELSSGDSDDGENFSNASTSVPSQPVPEYSTKPPTRRTYRRDTSDTDSSIIVKRRKRAGRKKRERRGNYLIRNIKIPMRTRWRTAFFKRSVNPSSQRGRKRGPRIPKEENVDFSESELPVSCGNAKGTLRKDLLKQGIHVECIQSEDKQEWFTPRKFEIRGGRERSKNWKQSIRCKGWTLGELIKKEKRRGPPRKKVETPTNPWQTKRKLKNPKECKVCCKPRRVYPCATCKEFYHKNCHIPPVEVKSSLWQCTFCKTKNQLRCQKNEACHKEAEVLKRKMSPEEQLKCELLLLTIYCCPKSEFFIRKPKQRKRDFPDLQKHMWLNKIKNGLNKKACHSVKHFVWDMRLIFQNHCIFYKNKFKNLGIRVGNKFEKTFKRIFSIEDTSKQHQPCKHTVLLT
uniref:nuclear autoantigen Sp-100-like n=1 Tax=Arvicanthis niloticus TaxID=61156 RepID=UPI0014863A25|nr:nuclear autoantigen Sp-100-like [Arvicanthis niloticus]